MAEDGQTPINEIQIGDETYTIARFKGLKATIAAAMTARVMREIPEIQDRATAARRKYREENTTVITRALAKTEQFSVLGLTDADFDNAENGQIELPEEPSNQWLMAKIWPDVFDLADKEIRMFLALMVISNRDLEMADDADNVDQILTENGKRLIREGDLDELLELFVVGLDVLKEQMARKKDRLGKLQIPLIQMLLRDEEESKEIPQTLEDLPGEDRMMESSQPESSPSDSFTDLPIDTDGVEETSYTQSLGTS